MAFEKLRRSFQSADKNHKDVNAKLAKALASDWMKELSDPVVKQLEKNLDELLITKYGKELAKLEADGSVTGSKRDKKIKQAYTKVGSQALEVLAQYQREAEKQSAEEKRKLGPSGSPTSATAGGGSEVAALFKVILLAVKAIDKAGGALVGLNKRRKRWDYTYDSFSERLKKWGGKQWYEVKKAHWREKAEDLDHPDKKVRYERKLREKIAEIQPIHDEFKAHHDELRDMAMERAETIKKERDAIKVWKEDQAKKLKKLDAYVRFDASIKKLGAYKQAHKGIEAGAKRIGTIEKVIAKEEQEAVAWYKDAKTRGANTLTRIGGALEGVKSELETSLAKNMA